MQSASVKQFSSKRQLLIFGKQQNGNVDKQMSLLKQVDEGVKERAIDVKEVNNENALWKKYNKDNVAFLVVLIGKDGTEKHRTTKILPAKELFAIIDAMPMRKAEMKKKTP